MQDGSVSTKRTSDPLRDRYSGLVSGIGELLESARHATVRVVNSFMTATYWEIGRRIVEFEQGGRKRAGYGEELIKRLSRDLTVRFGRGFSARNLEQMRQFYACWPIPQTVSADSAAPILQTASAKLIAHQADAASPFRNLSSIAQRFPLPWSHYVRLLSARSDEARAFYEEEALRGGWSVRQLDRQMNPQFYERTAHSKQKTTMLKKGAKARPGEALTAQEAIRDPLVLEFLNLKDEYSETDLEEALVKHLETFLLELGGDFAFVGRQRRLRIDDEWYRVDLLFFHRRLRCLVIIDLKLGRFTHADAGQMHLYLAYARQYWTQPGENPPVGLILCSSAGQDMVRYTLDDLPSKVLAKEYRLALPDEDKLAREMQNVRTRLGR